MDRRSSLFYSLICDSKSEFSNDQKKLIKYRRLANWLYFEDRWSKNRIAREMDVSKHFVIRWTESPDQDVSIDKRGWIKGRRRKWCKMTETRIQELHKQLVEEPTEFFSGATAVQHCWRLKYPDNPPPVRTIGQIMKDLNLTSRKQKDSRKGAARYLCYPEKTVYGGRLGSRVMEADFIVRRYLKGSSIPLHFVGFSDKKSPRLRYFMRMHAL